MTVRKAIVAGQFYPGSEKQCNVEIEDCLNAKTITQELPANIVAAIVPHAGWTFSGDLAAMTLKAIKQANETVDTFVIFGAVHSYFGSTAAVYNEGAWETPMGLIEIDADLAGMIIEKNPVAKANIDAHKFEHSIEVQLPFIQYIFDQARIVPVMIPPADFAVQLGKDVADCIKASGTKKIVCLASTDLTHYGPRYGFNPQGNSPEAIQWAKDVNDQKFIDLALNLETEAVVTMALEKENACGPGAAAAAIAAAKQLGKKNGVLLAHTNSAEVIQKRFAQPSEESVGYAGIVF